MSEYAECASCGRMSYRTDEDGCTHCRDYRPVVVWEITMAAASPQGVPGEPESGLWVRKVAARDEAGAVDAARNLFPGWTVIKADVLADRLPIERNE